MARQKEREVKELVVQDDSNYMGSNLPVTQADFDALSTQREMLKGFVSKQLTAEVDYGVVPGTKKNSLYKPGAEKLKMLFGLGARFIVVTKEHDRKDNYLCYEYKCEVYHLKTDRVVAECVGICSSQEKKYATRGVYEWKDRKRVLVKTEPTPVADVQNTISKMAQKRAFVGAIILATGASDFFTQDLEDYDNGEGGATKDVSPSEPKSQFASDDRVVRIAKLFESCRKHGISQADITRKFNLKKAEDITDDQANELAGFGRQIANKEKTVKEIFEVKNENS
ncbi:hypothetical protein [Bdellovibrio sp. HCB288]|uniref:hypothetical protein n=1 Tax=Bdellovibrio sp. HCB288 TaxID=3394355 RepID=UPI0039B3AFD9